MFWTIFWLCNIPFYFYTAYRIAGQFAWHEYNEYKILYSARDRPKGEDLAFGWFLGLMCALAWPLALLISLGASTHWMLYTPKHEKIKMYQKRIKELELEVLK